MKRILKTYHFAILVVTLWETKIWGFWTSDKESEILKYCWSVRFGSSFSESQFTVSGYKLFLKDRN